MTSSTWVLDMTFRLRFKDDILHGMFILVRDFMGLVKFRDFPRLSQAQSHQIRDFTKVLEIRDCKNGRDRDLKDFRLRDSGHL